MKKNLALLILITFVLFLLAPSVVYAREGDCGYEGGISSRQASYGTQKKAVFEYQEMCFISGEPIVFKGTMSIDRSSKEGSVTVKYDYDLENMDMNATLRRSFEILTTLVKKDNGQIVEESSLGKRPTENIRIGDTVYTLRSYEFTRSNLVDPKPAINYFAGNTWFKKVYQIGTGAGDGTVTTEATGSFYGYDQYWGSTQVQIINYIIECEKRNGDAIDKWGGKAKTSLSSSSIKKLLYMENEPDQISFDGGYVEMQHDTSIMEYSSSLPEFDYKGVSTDNMIEYADSLKTESFPSQKRLPVPDLRHLRGHWAENDIKVLYSLEVFKDGSTIMNPEQYITRGEFISAFVQAAKEVPEETVSTARTVNRTSRVRKDVKEEVISPFKDVSVESLYFTDINNAYKRGLIIENESSNFRPNATLTLAEVITVFIKALGLETLAPSPGAVTVFRDNDDIPGFARDATYVAQRIGLINGDDRGYLKPNEKLSKARAAALINRFIEYMRNNIREEYGERLVNYN